MTHRTSMTYLLVSLFLLGGSRLIQAEDTDSYDIKSRSIPFGIGEIPAEVIQVAYDATIRLVQAEQASEEVRQPSDFGSSNTRLTSLQNDGGTGRAVLDLGDLSSLLDAKFSSSATSNLSTTEQVEAVQQITQRVDTGVTATAPIDIIPASTFALASQPDVAETIAQNSTAPTVRTQRRSPIAMDPRVRGYRGGQIYTAMDGSYLTPVRPDLDAILSKVDQSLIGSTQVISGPYGLRYGSGFSFINVDTIPTPRYENGGENHLRLGTHVRPNGGQTYNTATLMGGGDEGGYYANVGYRRGSDYTAGDGTEIPSSYDAFNLFSAYGRDLGKNLKMETKFSFLDQGETEYAGQFFDVDSLTHLGLSHSFIYDNAAAGIGIRADAWVANTDFRGDTDLGGKRRDDFAVLQRVDSALAAVPGPGIVAADPRFRGEVGGELTNVGFRLGLTSDPGEGFSWGAGTDLRYVQHSINETYDITQFGYDAIADDGVFGTGLPEANLVDPGLYVEGTKEMGEIWEVAVGGRIAFASTYVDAADVQANSNFRDINDDINRDLSTDDTLLSYYLNNDFELNRRWSSRVGFGYAERLPDLTDRYSDGLFLAVIQSGFSRVIGNPELKKERAYQLDVRFDGEYDNFRTRLSAFHAWIEDYNTYAANAIVDPTGARLLIARNTGRATLAGFEAYAEADLLEGIQSFASLSYVDGRDREIDQPLPGIFPLESRVGVRITDVGAQQKWGLEWGWRIVDNQDRLASLVSTDPIPSLVPLETETPGFTTSYLRTYYRPSDRWSFTGGIENLFDKSYFEHLNLRLPAANGFDQTVVLSPGITPYLGVEVQY